MRVCGKKLPSLANWPSAKAPRILNTTLKFRATHLLYIAHSVVSEPDTEAKTEVTLFQLADEVSKGEVKYRLPNVPWGSSQIAQVLFGGVGAAFACGLVPLLVPDLQNFLIEQATPGQPAALAHLLPQVLLACAVSAAVQGPLAHPENKERRLFVFDAQPGWIMTTCYLCAFLFPLVDPALYSVWSKAVEAITNVPPATSNYAAQLHDAVAAGDAITLALHGAATCFVGPFWEEMFWRGFLLAALTRVLPVPACIAVSSATFSALHLSPHNALPILLLSVTCDFLRLRSGSLAPPLLLHAAWNSYEFLAVAFLGKETFV